MWENLCLRHLHQSAVGGNCLYSSVDHAIGLAVSIRKLQYHLQAIFCWVYSVVCQKIVFNRNNKVSMKCQRLCHSNKYKCSFPPLFQFLSQICQKLLSTAIKDVMINYQKKNIRSMICVKIRSFVFSIFIRDKYTALKYIGAFIFVKW